MAHVLYLEIFHSYKEKKKEKEYIADRRSVIVAPSTHCVSNISLQVFSNFRRSPCHIALVDIVNSQISLAGVLVAFVTPCMIRVLVTGRERNTR